MDGKMILEEILSLQGLSFKIEDCNANNWFNDRDTLIVRIAMNDVDTAIQLTSAMKALRADEITTRICTKNNRRYMRFWWD